MTIRALYPDVQPSLALNFARSKSLDPRITFTRASSGTVVDEDGVLSLVGNNVPRISYDSAAGKMGLLIEEARTNLCVYSEQFNNAAWNKTRSSITANATTAPDGSVTADKLVEDTTASATHFSRSGALTSTGSNTHTASCYVKAGERTWVQIAISTESGSTNNVNQHFDISNGALGNGGNVGDGSGSVGSIQDAGNGWYRCILSGIPNTTGGASVYMHVRTAAGANTTTYTGDGTSGIYIWGAQLEQAEFPTSYIPTTTAATTRAADVAVMTGTNFSSWYNQTEGTFVAAAVLGGISQWYPLYAAYDGTLQNVLMNRNNAVLVTASGTTNVNMAIGVPPVGVPYKTAVGYSAVSVSGTKDGATPAVDTSVVLPLVNRLSLGAGAVALQIYNGHIFSLSYWPKRLSEAQLQVISL